MEDPSFPTILPYFFYFAASKEVTFLQKMTQ